MVAWGFEWYGYLATPASARTDIVWYKDKRDVMMWLFQHWYEGYMILDATL